MKKNIFLLFALLLFKTGFCQTNPYSVEKTKTFCKVWGFLKYYHNKVATGNNDWDSVFVSRLAILDSLESHKKIEAFYSDWISNLGTNEVCNNCNISKNNGIKPTINFAWIDSIPVFTTEVKKILHQVRNNPNQNGNFYVQQDGDVGNAIFKNEKEYKDSIFPGSMFRLLTLSRYWNIIEYFYPYKHLIGKNWDNVLTDFIPKFVDADDTIPYNMVIAELTASLNDSHAGFMSLYTNKYFGYNYAPFKFKIIDGKAVVTGYYNEKFCKANKISIGDIFTHVKGIKIDSLIRKYSKFIGGSNEAFQLWAMQNILFRGNSDSLEVTQVFPKGIGTKKIKLYYFYSFNYHPIDTDTIKIIDKNIAYVNLGLLTEERVESTLRQFLDKKAIIFDLRAYPNWTWLEITTLLNDSSRPFAKKTIPDLTIPGTFKKGKVLNCGRINKNYYKGLVVILVNENTISRGEFTAMTLKTAPHAITIGSQTAGADGDASWINLPGDYKTKISGAGYYYPNGTLTQRIGIIPDITVHQSVEGLQQGKDEQLEAAIKIIRGFN